jgi:allantoinase
MKGVVKETWVRGKRVYTKATGFNEKTGPNGTLLLEPRTFTKA